MAEVAPRRDEHRSARVLDGGEDLGVTEGAAGLDDRGHAGLEQERGPVRKREERVRGRDGAAGAGGRVQPLCFRDRLAAGVDAAHLPRAEPDELPVADEDDGVRDDAPDQPPGEIQVRPPRRPSGLAR